MKTMILKIIALIYLAVLSLGALIYGMEQAVIKSAIQFYCAAAGLIISLTIIAILFINPGIITTIKNIFL